MSLDSDIAAADALELERLSLQAYRNEAADLAAHRAAVREHQAVIRSRYLAHLDWLEAQYAALPGPDESKRLDMALTLAERYFTTSTATLPESVQLDATNDARRFRAALEEALKVV